MSDHMKKPHIKSPGEIILRQNKEEYIFYGSKKQINKALNYLFDIGLTHEKTDSTPWRQTEVYHEMIENHGNEASAYLAGLRAKHDLTQKELASKLNVTRQMISLMERGKKTIKKDMAKQLSDIFNCDYKNFIDQ